MKKILVGSGIIMMTTGLFAQEAADKKVQAGIVLGSGLAMQKMGTNYIQTNGVGTDLTIGANVNFSLTETIAFSTGLEFDFENLKYKAAGYNGNNLYYWYNDKEIITLEDQSEDPSNTNHNLFEMQERSHKAMYLTIPTMMVFRTNFIGYMRYFGKFGLRNSFLLSNTITDTGFNLDPNAPLGAKTSGTNEDMKAPGEMFFFKSAVGLAAGAEWNFSGSTSLVAEIGYYYGFTPLHTNRNTDKGRNYTFATPVDADPSNDLLINNKATQSQLQLKVSILF